MINQFYLFYLQYATPAFSSGISSCSTSTLTPTTLSNLEQTFIELQSVPSRTMQNPITQSGFVPPIVHSALQSENDAYSDSSSNMSADDYLPSAPKKVKIGDKTTTIMSKYEIENPQRKTHRRQIREDEVSLRHFCINLTFMIESHNISIGLIITRSKNIASPKNDKNIMWRKHKKNIETYIKKQFFDDINLQLLIKCVTDTC